MYLHLVDNVEQFDYTLYDKETMRQIYYGHLDVSAVCEHSAQGIFNAARYATFEDYGITPQPHQTHGCSPSLLGIRQINCGRTN